MAAAGCQKHPIRWLTAEDIRNLQRMRRQVVVNAMLSGELPYEQCGRIRYARLSDVEAWEESRLSRDAIPGTTLGSSGPRRVHLSRPWWTSSTFGPTQSVDGLLEQLASCKRRQPVSWLSVQANASLRQ